MDGHEQFEFARSGLFQSFAGRIAPKLARPPRDGEYLRATARVAEFRSSHGQGKLGTVRVSPPCLFSARLTRTGQGGRRRTRMECRG